MSFGGKERTPACPQCMAEHIEIEQRAIAEERLRSARQSLRDMLGHAGIPPRFMERGFSTYQAETEDQRRALEVAKAYAESFEEKLRNGAGLMLLGLPGTGKTHLATAICKGVIRSGRSAVFTGALDVIQLVKSAYRRNSEETERSVIRRFAEPDLLCLDEVGVQHDTETERVILTDLVNKRYEHLRPTIMLSNLAPKELEKLLGKRIMDRMREVNTLVTFEWGSWRGRV